MEGRRIVDLGYLLEQIVEISKHPPFDCTFSDMRLINEHKIGLVSKLTFTCRMCNLEKTIDLTKRVQDELELNDALVLATISTGTGYSTAEEMFAVLNIPFMTSATYQKHYENVAQHIEGVSWKVLEEAGREEAQLARELGQLDEDGIPMVAVIADGAWSKRSYSVNYDASSGVVSFHIVISKS